MIIRINKKKERLRVANLQPAINTYQITKNFNKKNNIYPFLLNINLSKRPVDLRNVITKLIIS